MNIQNSNRICTCTGVTINKVLNALDALDRHGFEHVDANNSLDTLYAKIFTPPGVKDSPPNSSSSQDDARETRTEYVSVKPL